MRYTQELIKTLLLIPTILAVLNVFGQNENSRIRNYNSNRGVVLEGYDPVSFFEGEPKEGKEDIELNYKGLLYFFSSQVNRNKFKMNSEKYEPAYGGWCAYAMGATGEKVKIDPETYKIVDGKLYLFYNFWGKNTLEDWNKNEEKLKTAADKNWKKFIP